MNKQNLHHTFTLELKDVSKDYIQGALAIDVLKNINLSVQKGELVGIIGASGSGKSTLLHISGILDRKFSGDVLINGVSTKDSTENMRDNLRLNHIGFVYQYHHLLSDFNARENVAMPSLIANNSDYDASLDKADILLDKLDLGKRTFNYPGELSGGQQQRVAIARSLMNNPGIILADEPTGNLDNEAAENVIEIFVSLARECGLSFVIVTHNHNIARKMDTLYELRNGILVTV